MIETIRMGKPVWFFELESSATRFGPDPQITIPASGF
jgi:hypothetical protein